MFSMLVYSNCFIASNVQKLRVEQRLYIAMHQDDPPVPAFERRMDPWDPSDVKARCMLEVCCVFTREKNFAVSFRHRIWRVQ